MSIFKWGALRPADMTDTGQAILFAKAMTDKMRYSDNLGWLVYNGKNWEPNEAEARRQAHRFTRKQLTDAKNLLLEITERLMKPKEGDSTEWLKAEQKRANEYLKFAEKERNTYPMSAFLKEAGAILFVDVQKLDADGFLLNTPAGTVDLRTGKTREHSPRDLLTKITAAAPDPDDGKGREIWTEFLDTVTEGNADISDFLQLVAGQAAVGMVFMENLVIAAGEGGCGKSTLFNCLMDVLGTYATAVSADLFVSDKREKKHELVNLRGQRLVLCGELQSDGQLLDTAMLKRLCSKDSIYAERKYKDGFSFKPSHTVCMFTNHLPMLKQLDSGTKDRLVIVPFNRRIRGTALEIKNYESYLAENAGGYILSWVIEGAKKFLELGGKVQPPEAVQAVTEKYFEEQDTLGRFLRELTEISTGDFTQARMLYRQYVYYTKDRGEFPLSEVRFAKAMKDRKYTATEVRHIKIYINLKLIEIRYDEFGNRRDNEAELNKAVKEVLDAGNGCG